MRQALADFRDSQDAGDSGPGAVAGDEAEEDAGETPEDRAAVLEEENRKLRETVKAQAEELEPLVAEWRETRAGIIDGAPASRVDRAVAAVRRWELEVEMLREFQLTLPPETEALDESSRRDHIRSRE